MKKIVLPLYVLFSLLFLLYLLYPGPNSIDDFPALPDSEKSDLAGDTWQEPSLKAYYSNNYRDFVISYYKKYYENIAKFPFKALRLNYPPEFAFTAIKDQTKSTYLEEVTYPLRDSLYINGLEPFNEKDGSPRYAGATRMGNEGEEYETKVIIRFIPSSPYIRILVWFLINLSFFILYFETKLIFGKK